MPLITVSGQQSADYGQLTTDNGQPPVTSSQSPVTNHSPSRLTGTKALFLGCQKRKFATPRWTSAVAGSSPGIYRHIRRRALSLTVPERKGGVCGAINEAAISAASWRLPHRYCSYGYATISSARTPAKVGSGVV